MTELLLKLPDEKVSKEAIPYRNKKRLIKAISDDSLLNKLTVRIIRKKSRAGGSKTNIDDIKKVFATQ